MELIGFNDYAAVRARLRQQVAAAVSEALPLGNERFTLKVENLRYASPEYSLKEQKAAILENRTLTDRLVGNYIVVDNVTGKPVSKSGVKTVMNVPYLTDRGTYIRNGVEYTVAKQFRLVPNVYTRIANDGYMESHFNIKPRTGTNFKLRMNPETSIFQIAYRGREVPLYPLLRFIGVEDDSLKTAWGNEIFDKNKKLETSPHSARLIRDLLADQQNPLEPGFTKKALEVSDDNRLNLLAFFSRMELDPDAARRTLGAPHAVASPDTFVAATQKMLRLARREVDADDRDSLEFQTVHDVDDFLYEKIKNDQNNVLRQQLWRLTNKNGDASKLPSGLFDKHADTLFTVSGLAQTVEEINPMEMYDLNQRVIRLGEGGISSLEAVPKESRNVQSSYLNFVDPVRAPECYSQDTEVMTRSGWKAWPDVVATDEFACLVENRLEYHRATKLVAYDYSDLLYGASAAVSYLVTPEHRMWCRPAPNSKTTNPLSCYRIEEAAAINDKQRAFQIAGHLPLQTNSPDIFCLSTGCGGIDIPMMNWLSFLGYFVAYGECVGPALSFCFNSKALPEIDKFWAVLSCLPLNCGARSFTDIGIENTILQSYLEGLGPLSTRRIPEIVFAAAIGARESFVASFCGGQKAQISVANRQLAEDFQKLLFELGQAASLTSKPVRVYIYRNIERSIRVKKSKNNLLFTVAYSGKVYCAEVPGGLLYVRRKSCGFWCGNSLRVGIDLKFARGVKRGADKQLYTQFTNAQTGKTEWLSGKFAARSIIGFPGTSTSAKYVPAMVKSTGIFFVPRKDVEYYVPSGDDIFSDGAGLVPLKSGTKAMRLLLGSKMSSQALPLISREAPYVQTKHPEGSVERFIGASLGAVRSKKAGTIRAVYTDHIDVANDDGTKSQYELYNNYPFSKKTYIRNTPVVRAGARVGNDELLATSNYTDDKGVAALGTNLRVAYASYYGKNFADGVVISESAARKLSSEHLYSREIEPDASLAVEKKKYRVLYPAKYTREQFEAIDDNGVIRPGTVVTPGDPLFLAVREKQPELSSMGRRTLRDESLTWEHPFPGVVTDVAKTRKGYSVYIRANAPMQLGDKMSGRFGNKGVVAAIVKDDEMLRDTKGVPYEILIHPLTVVTRINPSQLIEAQLGKIVAKTKKPYVLPGFSDENLVDFVKNELAKNRLNDTEDMYDPVSNKTIPEVFSGQAYFYKLSHTAESKGKARSVAGYTYEEQPGRSGAEASKHWGDMEIQGLLAHNAKAVLKDIKLIKGQKNDEFWRRLKFGETPTMPGTPFVYDKFRALIRAAGVNLTEDKNSDHIFAMTNDQVRKLTGNREITSSDTFGASSLKPIAGGLFDPERTGSQANGDLWSYYTLPEPLPNPIMEDPLRSLLQLSKKDYYKIVEGEVEIDGKRGGAALKSLLTKIDLPTALRQAMADIEGKSKSKRDDAVKRFHYISAMLREKTAPADFVMERIAILPPKYRPIIRHNQMTMVADPNYLYKALIESSRDLAESTSLPPEFQNQARKNLYDNYRALVGVADPVQKQLQQKNIGGILEQLLGKGSPKMSFVQRRVIGTNTDITGLNVITPNPALKLNEVGLPEDMAWNIYEPFIIRNMVEGGFPAAVAARAVADKSPAAYKALRTVVKERPVLVNRPPTLHKYNILAFWPVLTKGRTLQIPPAIVKPMNADFDGNCCAFDTYILLSQDEEANESEECSGGVATLTEAAVRQTLARIKIGEFPRVGTPIKDRKGADVYNVPEGLKVLSYDFKTGKVVFAPVTGFTEEKDCPCVEVKTASQAVIVSDNESLCVFDHQTGELVKQRPAVSVGAFCPVITKIAAPFGEFGNRELGWVFGMFISDGWINRQLVGLAKLEDGKRSAFVSLCRQHLTSDFSCREYSDVARTGKWGVSKAVRLSGKLADEFRRYDFYADGPDEGRASLRKQIPAKFIQEGSEEFLWGLLSGLVDGDGSVSENTSVARIRYGLRISTSSPFLRDSCRYLFQRLGIRCNVTTSPPRNQSRESYTVIPSADDMRLCLDKLSCVGAKEQAVLRRWQAQLPGKLSERGRIIPLTFSEAEAFLRIAKAAKDDSARITLSKALKTSYPFATQAVLERLLDLAPELNNRSLQVRLRGVFWERIESVEDAGRRNVYDLLVEGTKIFAVNNGLVVYDTGNYTVPTSKEAVEEAIRLMLPEKNLISSRLGRPAFTPTDEYLAGLYFSTKEPVNEPTRTFRTKEDAYAAYKRGEIRVDSPIVIGGPGS
jgi:DNA-directed RNA polymerase beta subunit/intein/homing endonuclease